MGHSTCLGPRDRPHPETRSCDRCDACPWCERVEAVVLYCWRCCGPLHCCPACLPILARHVTQGGRPEGQWAELPEVAAGYRRAVTEVRGWADWGPHQVLDRWPILTAHLVCASLGYFTPVAAAGAIQDYLLGRPNFCEWYMHMARGNRERLLAVGKEVIQRAFAARRLHTGSMAHYPQARALVQRVRDGEEGPPFMSW